MFICAPSIAFAICYSYQQLAHIFVDREKGSRARDTSLAESSRQGKIDDHSLDRVRQRDEIAGTH